MRVLINDTSKSPLELAMLARLLQKELVKPSPAPQLAVSFCSACAAPCCDNKELFMFGLPLGLAVASFR